MNRIIKTLLFKFNFQRSNLYQKILKKWNLLKKSFVYNNQFDLWDIVKLKKKENN